MCWVLGSEECVQYQHVDTVKRGHNFVGNFLGVGYVAEAADPVAVNGDRPVGNSDGQDIYIADAKSLSRGNRVRVPLWFARAGQGLDGVVEDVREPLRQPRHRIGRAVHLDRHIALVRKRADVVDAVHVIGVIMGEKNCVDLTHAGTDQLETQLWWSIDENADSTVGFDERANSRPLVAWISRSAHLARTPNLGDAKTGSRPQKRQSQTVSTFSKLVVPGMSNGTPAVTMMRSPLLASSRATTTPLVRSIISS